jgi:hypothetical protein
VAHDAPAVIVHRCSREGKGRLTSGGFPGAGGYGTARMAQRIRFKDQFAEIPTVLGRIQVYEGTRLMPETIFTAWIS